VSETKTVRVSILDKDYQVSCKESEVTALRQSAQFLDQKMREIKQNSNVFGLDRLAVMAALNLTHDLLAQSEKATQMDSKQHEISSALTEQQTEIRNLHNKVDSALSRLKAKN